jgi:transposase-like protein
MGSFRTAGWQLPVHRGRFAFFGQASPHSGVPPETLRRHVRRVDADQGLRGDLPSSEEREEIKRLRREVYELRRANEILKAASVFSRPSSMQTDRSEPLHR